MDTMKATCCFTEVNEVAEVIDNNRYWGQKAKNIKATEAKDIEVTEARDIEAGKAIEVPEVAQFLEFLEASAKPKIDTTRKERKTNSVSKFFSLQLLFVNFVNKPTNFLFLVCLDQIVFYEIIGMSNLSTSQQIIFQNFLICYFCSSNSSTSQQIFFFW